jgi:hypothetical protein
MNQEIINGALPVKRIHSGGGRACHSRLEPFVDFIRELRQRRKTWREIAGALSDEKGCAISAQGVHQFYRRHLQRRSKGHWEDQLEHSDSQPVRPSTEASQPQSRSSPLPPEPTFKRPDLSKFNMDHFT